MKGPYPFSSLPTGWFQVAYSHELGPEDVVPLKYFATDLVMFRDADGTARVLDAFCPHLGAHLGHGGKWIEGTVECPFHAWRFDGGGACTHVPYADRIPPKAKLRAWPVTEVNGLILVWHHAGGEPPHWEVPQIPEYGHDEWTEYDYRRWEIRTINQEMAENAVDCAHFHYLHGSKNLPSAEATPDGHILRTGSTTVMETPMGDVEGHVEVEAYGFGFTLTRFTGLAETLLVNSVTPIDYETVDCRFAFTIKKVGGRSLTKGVAAAFIKEIKRQLEQDIPIWENKVFLERPALCGGDGPIGMYRRWCKQFYVEPGEAGGASAPARRTA